MITFELLESLGLNRFTVGALRDGSSLAGNNV